MSEKPPSRFRPPEVEAEPKDRRLFRVTPLAYIALGIFAVALIAPIYYAPRWGWVFLVLPAGYAWWVARSWTRVDDDGVRISTWRSRTHVPWERIKGLNFPKRGSAQLVTTSDEFIRMSAVGFNDLPRLAGYLERATSRPAFTKALADHMAHWQAADQTQSAPA